jgi:futalosine hydrolase
MVKSYLRNVRDRSIDDDLPVRLQKTLSAGIGFIKRHPLLYRLYLRLLFDAKAPFRDEILSSLRKYSLEFLESLLETAKMRGELQETSDIKKTAFLLDAIMDRFLQAYAVAHLDAGLGIFSASPEQTEEWIQDLVASICSGIRRKSVSLAQPSDLKNTAVQKPYILILSATEEEVSGLLTRLENPIASAIAFRKFISGHIQNMDIKVLITGPGLVNTSQALTGTMERNRPLLVIQTGCCGAFKESGLNIGDIAFATEEIDVHLGIEPSIANGMPDSLPFTLFRAETGEYKNRYPINSEWIKKVEQTLYPQLKDSDINLVKGPFVTVSTITASFKRARILYEHYNAIAEQMEGSASAHICLLYNIPFIEIRGVSNMAGKRERRYWNIPLACKNCNEAILEFIRNTDLIIVK